MYTTRDRPDRAVQRAFGRADCAEQSTISDTLNVCTPENGQQLRQAIQQILRQHGQSYQHNYERDCYSDDVQWADAISWVQRTCGPYPFGPHSGLQKTQI